MIFLILSVILAIVSIILASAWLWVNFRFKYFVKRRIHCENPSFPYGNTREGYEGKRNIVYDIDEIFQ
jgi:hypothetical protein